MLKICKVLFSSLFLCSVAWGQSSNTQLQPDPIGEAGRAGSGLWSCEYIHGAYGSLNDCVDYLLESSSCPSGSATIPSGPSYPMYWDQGPEYDSFYVNLQNASPSGCLPPGQIQSVLTATGYHGYKMCPTGTINDLSAPGMCSCTNSTIQAQNEGQCFATSQAINSSKIYYSPCNGLTGVGPFSFDIPAWENGTGTVVKGTISVQNLTNYQQGEDFRASSRYYYTIGTQIIMPAWTIVPARRVCNPACHLVQAYMWASGLAFAPGPNRVVIDGDAYCATGSSEVQLQVYVTTP
jgi:hypothetical protein